MGSHRDVLSGGQNPHLGKSLFIGSLKSCWINADDQATEREAALSFHLAAQSIV